MGSLKFNELQELIKKENNLMNILNICDFYDGKYEKVVIKDGKKTNIYSLSKNIIALCIGILFDKKKLLLNDDVSRIFYDEYKDAISYKGVEIIDLLHHVSGIKIGFLDVDCEDPSSFTNDDYLEIIFKKGIYHKDKNHFIYSDSNYYLLGRIVKKIANEDLDAFIINNLFKPLDIIDYAFQYDPKHNQMGATGIFIDSKDVAKIASIFLNKGMYKNNRIVSEEFINLALNDLIEVDDNTQYGYSIWVDKKSQIRHGNGMLGQIFVLLNNEIISIISQDNGNKFDVIKKFLLEDLHNE